MSKGNPQGKDTKAKRLRLILGDQLNGSHTWYQKTDPGTLYLIAEIAQEASYVRHHIQKICAFFGAMQAFAERLDGDGHRVLYLNLDDTARFESLGELLSFYVKQTGCEQLEYQRPDEHRLACQLKKFSETLAIPAVCFDTEHFLLPFAEIPKYFAAEKHVRMENFYRKMRKRFNILMDGDQPEGGLWNYDKENRRALKTSDLANIPQPLLFSNDASKILGRIERHGIQTIGQAESELVWPINRQQALQLLEFFCDNLLENFGRFQDAMTNQSPYAWSLYHSRLSFALNVKILSPNEVINRALVAWHSHPEKVTLPQIEGFIRQILGWREYVRGMYWVNMPAYAQKNHFNASRSLPDWFWDGRTDMNCMKQAIDQSLQFAYAHHIQRLMITGNFALLAGIDPDELDAWYLGIYIDAIEWVELPNTRGMSQYADGGWVATKPYAASGNYVNKMSDYCKGCRYNVKLKTESDACPFNSLYWAFIDRNFDSLSKNPRFSFPINNWQNQTNDMKKKTLSRAGFVLSNVDKL